MVQKVHFITRPCAENWHDMSPAERGRYCDKCCKTVIDFTEWPLQEIAGYLETNTNVCGHLLKTQLGIPLPAPDTFIASVSRSSLSLRQGIAAIVLFVFCIMTASCHEETTGSHTNTGAAQSTDTTHKPHFDGGIAISVPHVDYKPGGDTTKLH